MGLFFHFSSFCFFESGFIYPSLATNLLRGQLWPCAPNNPACASRALGQEVWTTMPGWDYMRALMSGFYMGAGDLKSGPHVCAAGTSPTKLSPQPLKLNSFSKFHMSWNCVWPRRRFIDSISQWPLPWPGDILGTWLAS